MSVTYKTGKKPAQERPKDFLFTKYLETVTGIVVPPVFGVSNAFADWGMLGNGNWGDCVWAGGDHETEYLAWLAAGAPTGQPSPIQFTDANALSDYSADTGFNQNDPNTDQGTDVGSALEYRRKTGLIDANGNRHKIAAYVKLDPGNLDHLYAAAYVCEVVGIGFNFPTSAMDQFNAGQDWTPVAGATIDGGHYVPLIGRSKPNSIDCVTWGRKQTMSEDFFKQYCDEAYGILTLEGLAARTAVNYAGFNWQQLVVDAGLTGVISNDPGTGPTPPAPTPAPPAPAPKPAPLTPEQTAYFNWGWLSGVKYGRAHPA